MSITNIKNMGQIVVIRLKAKDDKSIIAINKLAKKAGIKRSFNIEADNIAWVEDINNNPESAQKHLKPITLEKLKEVFNIWCEVGLLSFDVAFSRTSQAEAKKYAQFILKHQDLIDQLEGAQELIERYDLDEEEQTIIKKLNYVRPAPVKLPVEERTKKDLQGGHMLCKSWGLQPFWVIFGNVESPVFMKERIFEEDIYNNLYRDKKGYGYLLLPLMPLGDKSVEFAEKVYDDAWSMGLREAFTYFIPMVYGLDITNIDKVAKDYREFYTVEELKERFYHIFESTHKTFPYGCPMGFIWRDVEMMFKPIGSNPTSMIFARCNILTACLRALGPKVSAEIMSKLTGRTYKEFEFTKK
jgi:hypothetical protein